MKTIANVSSKMVSDDEFYTPDWVVRELLLQINIPKEKVIWCPFDLENSNFVKVFRENGYKVLFSHIHLGQDFYSYEPTEKWDIIISNPPFKNKKGIINRCKELKNPYILLFGSAVCFQNGFANILNEHKLFFVYKPITFKSLNSKDKKFLGLWLGSK